MTFLVKRDAFSGRLAQHARYLLAVASVLLSAWLILPVTVIADELTHFYLNVHFSQTPEGQPLLHVAPANLSNEEIESLSITIDFPESIIPLQFEAGRYQSASSDSLGIQTEISYLAESDNWSQWGTTESGKLENSRLLNPPIDANEGLTETIKMRSVKLDFEQVPIGFRWRGTVEDQPTFVLSVPVDYEADWAEVCLNATGKLASGEAFTLEETCEELRLVTPAESTPNLNLRVDTQGATSNPRPGDIITFIPTLQLTKDTQADLDLVVDLPSWLEYITTTNSLEFIPNQPLTVTETIDPVPQLPQFEQRVAADTGNMRLVWRWPELTAVNSITMPVIQAEVRPGLPVGLGEVPFSVLSNDTLSCWDLPADGRDVSDIDLDQNRSELFCQTAAKVSIESVAGITADLILNGSTAPNNPIAADLTVVNAGTQPITTIEAILPVPEGWLIVPPQVPAEFAIAYATGEWCESEADCTGTKWTYLPPEDIRKTTGLRLKTNNISLLAGSSSRLRLFLQPPSDLDLGDPISWPPITINGMAESGESVSFELDPNNFIVQPVPLANIQGQAWIDNNRNGLLDDGLAPAENVPIALISPGGDGEPATADDRTIRWAITGEDGFYRFAGILPGPYYLATIQTQAQLIPTSLTVTNVNETDQITAFSSNTWRTNLFSVFRDQVSPTQNLSLSQSERELFSGHVTFDQNQNQIGDDPLKSGVNGLWVQLLTANETVLAQTTTRTDSFGQPGRFFIEAPENSEGERLLRFSGSSPFSGGTELSDGTYRLDLPTSAANRVQVLIDQASFGFDLGDAPPSYGIAEHAISPAATLGLISDDESIPADWTADTILPEDDSTALDDEEGIFFIEPQPDAGQDSQNHVVVVARNQNESVRRLNGWIDFDGDGRFSSDEKIIENHLIFPDINPQGEKFAFETPEGAICGPTFARFRLGSTSEQPSGRDASGEVEDIPYNIQCVTDLALSLEPQFTPMGPNELSNWYLSVTNEGSSLAEGVTFNVTIPGPVNYQGLVSLTNDPVACTDIQTARETEVVKCEIDQLAPGQTLTLNLAFFLPFDTDAKVVGAIGTVSSETADRNPINNVVRKNIKVEKSWVLIDPTYEPFTHVSYFPGIVNNQDLRELDFTQDAVIASVINVPISITIGVQTNRMPRLTVPVCVDNRDEITCNQTNFVEGQVIQEDYRIERIFLEDELIYEPEDPQVVRLNRIADPNMTRCGQMGSCVGYDLFRVGRGEIFPYAWNAPNDYFYMAFVTSGGRQITCPDEGYENRCFIKNDARPGDYEIEGFATVILVFDDTRLGTDTIEVRRKVNFSTRIRVVAPFVEPEVDDN